MTLRDELPIDAAPRAGNNYNNFNVLLSVFRVTSYFLFMSSRNFVC